MNGNFAFDSGEIWTFILQDWSDAAGGNPHDFDSLDMLAYKPASPSELGYTVSAPAGQRGRYDPSDASMGPRLFSRGKRHLTDSLQFGRGAPAVQPGKADRSP